MHGMLGWPITPLPHDSPSFAVPEAPEPSLDGAGPAPFVADGADDGGADGADMSTGAGGGGGGTGAHAPSVRAATGSANA